MLYSLSDVAVGSMHVSLSHVCRRTHDTMFYELVHLSYINAFALANALHWYVTSVYRGASEY